MNDWLIIICCGIYVAIEALLAYCGHKYLSLKGEVIRKFIHIMTSFLIFPLVYGISNQYLRLFGPVLFIVLNSIATFSGMGKRIGMNDDKRHSGLIVYPLSVLILVYLMNKAYLSSYSVVAGVLIMGLGDGMAALVGTKWGNHKYKILKSSTKSIEGTLSMFIVSFLVCLILTPSKAWCALLVAIFASVLENISPSGLDNATVPLLSAILLEVLCKL